MMLPVWYTLLYKAHKYGSMMLKPVEEKDAFLVGDIILVAPTTEMGQRKRRVRLQGFWYYPDFKTPFNSCSFITESEIEVEAELDQLPIFIKQGTIMLLYDNVKATTKLTRNTSNYTLWVFGEEAYGEVYLDNGFSDDSGSNFVLFTLSKGVLSVNGRFGFKTEKEIRRIVWVKQDSIVYKNVCIPLIGKSSRNLYLVDGKNE